ncbi:uncharacterized protein [Littorina saxatilis]|uniref:uncharacterized protein isoform X2 n=1 Tax=Littorina saxatilis TaxID=31220 RepID=UPI0038B67F97
MLGFPLLSVLTSSSPQGQQPGVGGDGNQDTPDEDKGNNEREHIGKSSQDNKGKASQASATSWLAIGLGVAGAVVCLGVGLGVAHHWRKKRSGQQSMTPAATPSLPPPPADGNTETAMNTGDTANVGQSGQDPHIDVDDAGSQASADSDADTASDASSDAD